MVSHVVGFHLEPVATLTIPPWLLIPSVVLDESWVEGEVDDSLPGKEESIVDERPGKVGPVTTLSESSDEESNVDPSSVDP